MSKKTNFISYVKSNTLIVFTISVMFTLLASTAMAGHVGPDQKCSNVYTCQPGCVCSAIIDCHVTYYCPTSPQLSTVDSGNLADSVVSGNKHISELDTLRNKGELNAEEQQYLKEQEEKLAFHYESILKLDPENFWANWDYAALKKGQGNHLGADRLYHDAISTLDDNAKIKIITNLQSQTIKKFKLIETLTPQKSNLIGQFRIESNIPDEYTFTPLVKIIKWKAKYTKKIKNVYNDVKSYTNCLRPESNCLINALLEN